MSVLIVVYVLAVAFGLELLTRILQGGAVVGLFALVVIFQPEIRRGLERIGRVGSLGWMLTGADSRAVDHVADEVARAAADLSAEGHGALIVLERETGLEDAAETGVMIHGDVSADLIRTIFAPRTALHDGAVIIRGETILAAGALPLAETTVQAERFGTRHRAALGIAEQTDAVVVVVSEENGQISLVERSRIVRNLNEAQLARTIRHPPRPEPWRRRRRLGVAPARSRQPPRPYRLRGDPSPPGHPPQLAPQARGDRTRDAALRRSRVRQSTQTLTGRPSRSTSADSRRNLPAPMSTGRDRDPLLRPVGGAPDRVDFEAWVDLSGIVPGSGSPSVPIPVESIDARVTVVGFEPDR